MQISRIVTFLFSAVIAASLPAKTDKNLRYVEGSGAVILASLDKESNGAVALGSDDVLRSLGRNGTIIDYRQLNRAQHESFARNFGNATVPDIHDEVDLDDVSFADGCSVVDYEQITNPPPETVPPPFLDRIKTDSPEPGVLVQGVVPADDQRLDGHGDSCSPALYCTDSSTCVGGGCTVCTWISFFPYGLCLDGGTRKN